LRYLFVGQLIDRKGVPELLEAFEGLPGGELQLAGEGPLRPLVEAAAARDPRIACLGHVDRNGLQQLYAEADVLVLPSRYEVWGLVVNEAIEHGLPVVTTDSVGAADDLVEPGVNGYVVDAGDALALRAAMARFSAWSDAEWETAGAASREIAERWTMDAAADAFVEACLAGLERRPSTIARRKRPFT
jgi:glycosyltransferase involved in cell wall biosynthesis